MKVVINNCFGGFGLSKEAIEHMGFEAKKYRGWSDCYYYEGEIERNDPRLIKAVEELGKKANGKYADLKIVEIPDDIEWIIEEYDGSEYIAESHRTWG